MKIFPLLNKTQWLRIAALFIGIIALICLAYLKGSRDGSHEAFREYSIKAGFTHAQNDLANSLTLLKALKNGESLTLQEKLSSQAVINSLIMKSLMDAYALDGNTPLDCNAKIMKFFAGWDFSEIVLPNYLPDLQQNLKSLRVGCRMPN